MVFRMAAGGNKNPSVGGVDDRNAGVVGGVPASGLDDRKSG